ncbi:MAG: YkgJ family cysteine cluster protein [Fimbriimonadaceae bacterium]|nr:YkgJ family cysteine cluster protein [Fimbriimonadaceae bacterium]
MPSESLARTVSNATWLSLSHRRRVRESIHVTASVHDRVDATIDDLVQRARDADLGEPDCKAGCWYCCQIRVHVTVPEVVRVARYVLDHFDTEEIRELVDRLHAYRAQLSGLDRAAYFETRLRCPLNVAGACSVHPARPIVCRRYLSYDVNRCIEHFVDNQPSQIPKLDAIGAAVEPYLSGLANGAVRANEPSLVNFPHALAVALTGDNLDRWQRGARVFHDCAARA